MVAVQMFQISDCKPLARINTLTYADACPYEYRVAWQPHGQLLAAPYDNGAVLHNLQGQEMASFELDCCRNRGCQIGFAPDGAQLCLYHECSSAVTIRLYNIASGECMQRLHPPNALHCGSDAMQLFACFTSVVTVSASNISFHSSKRDTFGLKLQRHKFSEPGCSEALAVSADGVFLAAVSQRYLGDPLGDGPEDIEVHELCIYEVATGRCLHTYEGECLVQGSQ